MAGVDRDNPKIPFTTSVWRRFINRLGFRDTVFDTGNAGLVPVASATATDTLLADGTWAAPSSGASIPAGTIAGRDQGGTDGVYEAITLGSGLTMTADTLAVSGRALSGEVVDAGLVATDARIVGRSAGSKGALQEITIGTGLTLASGELTADGTDISGKQTDSSELTALAALTGATLGRSLVTALAVSDIAAITTSSYRLDSEYGAPVRSIATYATYAVLYSFTIPANTIGAVRLSLRGDLIQNSTAKALKMKVRLGGSDVWGAQASGTVTQDSDRRPWRIDLDLASTGTGTQALSFGWQLGKAQSAGGATGIGAYSSIENQGLGHATPSADETTDLLIEVAFAWDGNATLADMRLFHALLEVT